MRTTITFTDGHLYYKTFSLSKQTILYLTEIKKKEKEKVPDPITINTTMTLHKQQEAFQYKKSDPYLYFF